MGVHRDHTPVQSIALCLALTMGTILASTSPAAAQRSPSHEEVARATSGRWPVGYWRNQPASDGDRILVELGLAMLGPVIGGVVGAVVGAAACAECSPGGRFLTSVLFLSYGLPAGVILSPFFVALGGDLMRGRGNLGGAALGFLGGAALGTPMVVGGVFYREDAIRRFEYEHADAVLISGVVLGGVLTIAGSMVGYEITHLLAGAARSDEPAAPALTLRPDVALDPRGEVRVGLVLAAAR